jgi:DNA-binding response OmpR family regulator/predicted regulator of Ras-like GTPase activity (Roadblock/LC7/MglB family)
MAKKAAVKKILVVDDEADILWSLKEFLVNKELQAQVVTAASGEEALEKLARERIDLVITDIKMPGMSGLDLLVEIKNRFPYISVIIMTAFPSSEFKREALLKGGMYFIEKPFDIKNLREKVMEALQETGQFKGMLTGISLSDVIQIKCMSGVTAALRVTEGNRQGIIFFQKGEIIHALCDELDGERAFYEIISFAHGHLDTVNIADLPERTIFKPYVAMLMEGSRRQDEQGGGGAEASRESGGDESDKMHNEVENIGFGQAAVAVQPEPRPLSMAELLAGFKTINGYRAAAIMKASGEILAQDAINNKIDLRMVGATLNDFFRNAREATGKIGLETCHEAVLGTRSDILIMGCSGGGDASLVLAVFDASGNQALGRREMRKVVGRLVAATA